MNLFLQKVNKNFMLLKDLNQIQLDAQNVEKLENKLEETKKGTIVG